MLTFSDTDDLSKTLLDLIVDVMPNGLSNYVYGGTGKLFSNAVHDFSIKLNQVFPNILFSQVIQKPLPDWPLALWLTILEGKVDVLRNGWEFIDFITPDYQKRYYGGLSAPETQTAGRETVTLLEALSNSLLKDGFTVKNHLHRTWFFLSGIYKDYSQFTHARKVWFTKCGLTKDTHYIASTGIQGGNLSGSSLQMDALVFNAEPMIVSYLNAHDHLNDTIEYGVTFERGTRLLLGKSEHIYISGTASIDASGNVLYPDSPEKQTLRTLKNIEALLKPVGASLTDVVQAIVYITNPGDFDVINACIESRTNDFPCIYTHAAVCRPQWLVEIECIIIKAV